MPYVQFDRSRLCLRPLAERQHDYGVADMLPLDGQATSFNDPALPRLAERLVAARRSGCARILMMGAHPIKYGLSRHIIDLLERGVFSAVAFNGACAIHDYELALVGATSEDVARYIRTGEFGLWQETGQLNDIARSAASRGIGFGEAVGQAICENGLPHREVSILAAGYRLGIPITVHVSLGYDIIHMHPNCDGAALGAASYADFLTFAHQVESLEGGVMLSVGTAIMGPEVYLKALSMARNVAAQEGRRSASSPQRCLISRTWAMILQVSHCAMSPDTISAPSRPSWCAP